MFSLSPSEGERAGVRGPLVPFWWYFQHAPSTKRFLENGWLLLLLFALVAGLPRGVFAQSRYMPRYQEPQWMTFNVTGASVGAYAEGNYDETSYKNSDTTVSHERLFVGPSLGLSANGSIYHPNLLTYYLSSDGAFGWSHDRVNSTTTVTREEFEYLGTFSSELDFLQNKPYHASAFANYDHTFRDNDFFNRVTVDSWRYGGRGLWQLDKWTFSADYVHRDETSENPFPYSAVTPVTTVVNGTNVITLKTNQHFSTQSSETVQDTLTVSARNERSSGGSSINYSWDRYTRSDTGRIGEGTDQSVSAGDVERFGAEDRFKLNASLSYFDRQNTEENSGEVSGYASLGIDHRPNLRSFYDFNYDHFETDIFTSDTYAGQAALQHQLYESLLSTLSFRASDYESSDRGNTDSTLRYGAGLTESYTKQLSAENRLHINNTLFIEETDQQSAGGIRTVRNERHTFSEPDAPPGSFFLNQPNVVEQTIVVTDLNHNLPAYLENFDYRVNRLGTRTLIERLNGSRIPDGAAVLVDYQADASSSGTYETLTDSFEIRFELWKNLLGIYGRLSLSQNNAPPELHVQNVTAYTVGADFTLRWFRTGAEFEIYESTESNYRSARLFQSVAFHPDEVSTFSLDLTETWIDYVDSHRTEEDYRFITRYHRGLTHRLALDCDAGIALRRGNGVDQFLATFRPSIKYVLGKTTFDAGYDYEYELFLNNEERHKHTFFARIKRMF
jgi:hypothetical protein